MRLYNFDNHKSKNHDQSSDKFYFFLLFLSFFLSVTTFIMLESLSTIIVKTNFRWKWKKLSQLKI